MPAHAVLGAQWGDEGKGKIVDFLAEDADIVARFSGGNIAGHTVINDLGELFFSANIAVCIICVDIETFSPIYRLLLVLNLFIISSTIFINKIFKLN